MRVARLWLALPLAVYLLLPTQNFYWDGVAFAIEVEKQLPLRETLHPNHLIYTSANVWLYHAALLLGLKVRALFLMRFVNIVLAEGCVILLYRALRRRELSTQAAIVGSLVFAFAATWWRFATDANAYIVSIFFVLCANDLLDRLRKRQDAATRHLAFAAALHAVAMLFHQLALLFLPVALFRLRDPKKAFTYLGTSLTPVALAYVFAYRTVFGRFDPGGLLRWVTAHSPDSAFSVQLVRDLSFTLLGTLRLFFGGRLALLRADSFTIAGSAALAACLIAIAVLWSRGGKLRFVPISKDLLLWIAVYVVFLFFWMPQNTFYRLFYLAPLVLALCVAIRGSGIHRWLSPLACGALFLWNLTFLIYPQSRAENNPPLRFALAQRPQWRPGTPIAFHTFHPDLWTISYFNPQAAWIGLETFDESAMNRIFEDTRARNQQLWLEATAYDFISANAEGRRWLASHQVSLPAGNDPKHEFKFYQVR